MLIRTNTTDNAISSVEVDGQVFLPERKLTQQLNLRNDIRTIAELSARVLNYSGLNDCTTEQSPSITFEPSGVQKQTEDELVHHPAHYNTHPSGIECIYLTWNAGFVIGNAIKYLYRNQHKQSRLKDLKKALWYVAYGRNNSTESRDEYFEFCPHISARSQTLRHDDFIYRLNRLVRCAVRGAADLFSPEASRWSDGGEYRVNPSVAVAYTAELRLTAQRFGVHPGLLREFRTLKLPDAKNSHLNLAKFILMSEGTREDKAILFLGTASSDNNGLQAAEYYIKALIHEEGNK